MPISTHTRSKIVGYTDQFSGLALKLGIPAVIISGIFLLVAAYGGQIRDAAHMSANDRKFLIDSLGLAAAILPLGAGATVAGAIMRLHREETPGHVLSLLGAVLFFGAPAMLSAPADIRVVNSKLFAQVIQAYVRVGAVCLLPGLLLLLRDMILRLMGGFTKKRVFDKCWGDEEARVNQQGFSKFYGSCWHMAFCREFVRKVCPAFQAHKPCWRVKVGCYCDEKTILKAMMAEGKDNEFTRGIMHNLGLDNPRETKLSNQIKRERCRRCGIYREHQRQKYKVASPMVFPLVGLVIYIFHQQIFDWLWVVMEKTDRFMSMLTYQTGAAASFASEAPVLTTLAMVWLSIMLVSYALRLLEYLVFEIQI